MTKYTKKPIVIDAEQWNGNNFKAIEKLLGPDVAKVDGDIGLVVKIGPISQLALKGDFILKESCDAEPKILSQFKFDNRYLPLKKK
tara:strand:+ start:2430 stop:2687 length:258 start_codon:yes stop_codon:yes gene_type:complete